MVTLIEFVEANSINVTIFPKKFLMSAGNELQTGQPSLKTGRQPRRRFARSFGINAAVILGS